MDYDAIVLTGGRGRRLGGVAKGDIVVAGRRLVETALAAVTAAREVVVVGEQGETSRPVVWAREHPPYGGPVAGLYAGLASLPDRHEVIVVLAVDMPGVTPATIERLVGAVDGHDGAVLVGGGRRHLAAAIRSAALDRIRPASPDGVAMKALWAALELAECPAWPGEADDVDTPSDLARIGAKVLDTAGPVRQIGPVNLHDWIDELCDTLDIDIEVDEGLVLDLTKVVADNVERPAAPVTAYLVGYAAGLQDADPEGVERLAAKAQALAEQWDRPANAPDPDDVADEVPDDSAVDHTGDRFED